MTAGGLYDNVGRNRITGYDWAYHDKVQAGIRDGMKAGDDRPFKSALRLSIGDESAYADKLIAAMDAADVEAAKGYLLLLAGAAARTHTWARILAAMAPDK